MAAFDIFAAALDIAPESNVVKDVAPVQPAAAPSQVIKTVFQPGASGTSNATQKALIQAMCRKQRAPSLKTQDLTQIAHDTDPTKNELLTIFIDVAAPSDATGPDSSRAPQCTPVCMWPQYELKSRVGERFIIVNATEDWFNRLITVVHGQASSGKHAVKLRDLKQYTMDALKKILLKGLSTSTTSVCAMSDDEEIDTSIITPSAKKRRYSGIPALRVSTVEAEVAGWHLTLLNYGKQFVMKLDESAIRFTTTHIVAIVRQLAVKSSPDPVDTSVVSRESQCAAYTFDDTTPNIRDKVTWDPIAELWRISVFDGKKHASRSTDENGKSLSILGDYCQDAWAVAKAETYGRAISAWNILDRSRRYRIVEPRSVALPFLSSDSQSDTHSADSPHNANEGLLSMADKWHYDTQL